MEASVSEAHQTVGVVAVVATLVLLVTALWSIVAARRSGGERDHRFAVDRALLLLLGVTAVAIVLGGVVFASGSRPADALHLLYAVVALVAAPVGWWLGGRGGGGRRSRRDGWLAVAALLQLGIELRLFMTG
jgi:amino acid transporter